MSGGILPGFFLEITFSQIGLTVSFLLGIGLLLALFTKRIRSPAAIVLSVLVLAVIVFQFSLVLWLMFSWGRNRPQNSPDWTPPPHTYEDDPHHDGHPRMNRGLLKWASEVS